MLFNKMTNGDNVPELTNGKFEEFTKKGVAFVDFFAEWCMPCLMMAPIVEELSEKFGNKVKFGKVNVGDNQQLAKKFEVSSIPCFIIFKDGKPVDRFVGSTSAEDLEEKIKRVL